MLQASLKVIGGKNDGKVIQFKTKKFLVGREQDCHLRPNSDLVSRHHCVFTLDDYALRLRDLGSTNGTLVNGRRIRGETLLMAGDVVRIGKLDLEVVIGSTAGAELVPPMPQLETTSNASAMDTAFSLPNHATLEDSGMITASPSSETVDLEVPYFPTEDLGSQDAIPLESETVSAGLSGNETVTDQPVPAQQPLSPQPPPQQYPPDSLPPNAWQYPPQYPQFQQFLPPGYPMGYPPGYPPGYGYPPQQPGQYPQGAYPPPTPPQPAGGKSSGSSGEASFPDIRLPNPEDTGVKKEPPKPAPSPAEPAKANESTPSKRAEELLNSSRRRRRTEEEA